MSTNLALPMPAPAAHTTPALTRKTAWFWRLAPFVLLSIPFLTGTLLPALREARAWSSQPLPSLLLTIVVLMLVGELCIRKLRCVKPRVKRGTVLVAAALATAHACFTDAEAVRQALSQLSGAPNVVASFVQAGLVLFLWVSVVVLAICALPEPDWTTYAGDDADAPLP